MTGLKSAVAVSLLVTLCACGVARTTYDVTKGTVKTAYKTTKFAYRTTKFIAKAGVGTVGLTYKLGKATFRVIFAPLDWPMTAPLESVAGLSPKEAIREGKVKNSPYEVRGKYYRPMSVRQAASYRQEGIASWYGEETRRQRGGTMTADGEVFNPALPTAAHKYLPLPTNVRVTNLENGRSILLRVNDRGPFVRGRIIDLSAGAAKQLGYYRKGTARVLVETVTL